MGLLNGEVALITGAAGGIGSAIAAAYAAEGAAVLLVDRHAAQVEHVAATIRQAGNAALGLPCDVTHFADCQAAVQHARTRWGQLNHLVNCVGLLRTGRVDEMDEADWNHILAVNVTGVFLPTKAAVPALKAAGGGSIVNLSSVSAFIGSDAGFAYTVTKGAVLSFTYGIAQELAPFNIRVNALCPGWVDAGFTHQALAEAPNPDALRAQANSLHALGRMARPEEVAQAAVFLASRNASFITGAPLLVDGGYMIKH